MSEKTMSERAYTDAVIHGMHVAASSAKEAAAAAIGARYRDGSGDVWTVREADATRVFLMRDESQSWSLGTGTFATQVRMGYLTLTAVRCATADDVIP